MPISHAELNEPLLEFGKRHANKLLELIRESSLAPSTFERVPAIGADTAISFSYDHPDSHGPISPLYFRLQLEAGTRNNWLVEADYPDFTYQTVQTHSSHIVSAGELYGTFTNWLSHIERYWRFRTAEEGPDLWEELLQASNSHGVTVWTTDSVFTQGQVADIRQKALAAIDSIAPTRDFTEEMRQVFREELDAHLPKAGQRWADWRQGFIGWGMALVLDGAIHSHVVSLVFNSVMSFLSAKAGVPIPPQLLP